MDEYTLTLLKDKVAEEMASLNPGTTPDMIFRTGKANGEFHYCADNHRPPLIDISPLAQMTDLTSVRLYNCMVSDLSPLEKLYRLENIDISSMQNYLMNECRNGVILPCDFTRLQKLRSLLLVAAHCSVPKLSGLPNLARIYLNRINSLEGLENQQSVKEIHIEENLDLSDLSPLASCPALERLEAYRTKIHDLTPLANHPNLKSINVNHTAVTDVSPLSTIPTLELVWLYGTAVMDVSCLATLPRLNSLNLYKTQVTDLSAFQDRENIINIERKKISIKKEGKTSEEIKISIAKIREKLDRLGIIPRPALRRSDITAFQERTGIKLPKEYVAFLTKIGDGFEVQLKSFHYIFPPLQKVPFDPERIKKRFTHREIWLWDDDENATEQKILSATKNGQLELVDCGCGESYRLIVCGGAKGEVWSMAENGIIPYNDGTDFLDWMNDFLDGKVIKS
ncbi:hypothetical protein N510_000203 [Firmicutes bacterium ASF500]|nr:hypothetical protein N510_000203 [Firmicutes bacterium ASF500]